MHQTLLATALLASPGSALLIEKLKLTFTCNTNHDADTDSSTGTLEARV
ncbi:hypothetical protein [Shewanella sp. FJAT-52076]|nr:hypothetical protein [Shewanella sp. FJAT-52076]QYJ74940.1 hypothetical protein K0H79_16595 [Shewanella sp. FJAT-52076]